jgi:hypothetical protein
MRSDDDSLTASIQTIAKLAAIPSDHLDAFIEEMCALIDWTKVQHAYGIEMQRVAAEARSLSKRNAGIVQQLKEVGTEARRLEAVLNKLGPEAQRLLGIYALQGTAALALETAIKKVDSKAFRLFDIETLVNHPRDAPAQRAEAMAKTTFLCQIVREIR